STRQTLQLLKRYPCRTRRNGATQTTQSDRVNRSLSFRRRGGTRSTASGREGGAHELLPLLACVQAIDGNDRDQLHRGTPDRTGEEDAGGDGIANLGDCPALRILQSESLHDGVPQAGGGYAKSFQSGFVKGDSKPKKGTKLVHLLRPHRTMLVLAFIAVLGEAGTDLLEPWPLKIVFDYVFGAKHVPAWMSGLLRPIFGVDKVAILHFAVFAVIVIALLGALSAYGEKYLTTSVGQWVMHDLRRILYHHIQRLSLAYHDQKPTGDLISTVTADIESIQDFISQALLGIVVNVLTLVGMLVVMFYLNWRFTLIALSVTPVLFVVVYTYTKRIKKASRALRKKEGEVVSVVSEVISSMRVVKAFAREDYEEERLAQQSLENVEIALKARSLKAKLAPVVQVIVAVGTCLVLWYGVNLVMRGEITTGSLLVFLLYLGKMYKPMRDLSKMTDTMSKAAVGYERIHEVIETEDKIRNLPGAKKAPTFRGEIEFEHVSFAYDNGYRTLNDINLRVESGQMAALVGPTGAGKTTIVSLIGRFYDPEKGVVKIDNRDVRDYKLKSLRRQISFVLQDTLLFRAPVWQNIAYGRPEASREEILR